MNPALPKSGLTKLKARLGIKKGLDSMVITSNDKIIMNKREGAG